MTPTAMTCGHNVDGTSDEFGRKFCGVCQRITHPVRNPEHDDAVTRFIRRMDADGIDPLSQSGIDRLLHAMYPELNTLKPTPLKDQQTRAKDTEPSCLSALPTSPYYLCTLRRGHAGEHIAEDSNGKVLERWTRSLTEAALWWAAEPLRLSLADEPTPVEPTMARLQRHIGDAGIVAQALAQRVEALEAENAHLRKRLAGDYCTMCGWKRGAE